jgi:hypothetical protein
MTADRDGLMSPSPVDALRPHLGKAQQRTKTMRTQQQEFWMGVVEPNSTLDAIIRIEQDDGRGICVILPRRRQNLSGYNYHSNKCP